jgi:hypothetical protein
MVLVTNTGLPVALRPTYTRQAQVPGRISRLVPFIRSPVLLWEPLQLKSWSEQVV